MAAPRKRKKEPPFDVTGIDFSVITTALQTGGKMIEQIINGIHYGSPEVRLLMLEECDFIIECRVCRGLFRALPNFIAHKRVYCCQAFCDHSPNMPFQAATAFTPPQEEPVVVLPTMPEDITPKEPGQVAHQRKCDDHSKEKAKQENDGKTEPHSDKPKGRVVAAQGKAPADSNTSNSSDGKKVGNETKHEAGTERSGMKTRSQPAEKMKNATEDHVVTLTQAEVGVSKEFVTLTAAMRKIEKDKEVERSAAPLLLTPIPSNPCAVYVSNKNAAAGQVISQSDISASPHTISVLKELPVSEKVIEKDQMKKPENSSRLAATQKNANQSVKAVTSAERTTTGDKAPAQSSKTVTSTRSNVRGAAMRNAQVGIAKGTLRGVTRVVRELRLKKDELSKKQLASKSEARLSSQKDHSSSSSSQSKPAPTLSATKPQFRHPVAATVAIPSTEKQVAEMTHQQKPSAFMAKRGESPIAQTTDTEGNLRAVVKRCLTGRPWALRTSPLKTRSVDRGSDVDSASNTASATVNEPDNFSDKEGQEQEEEIDDGPIMDLENLRCRVCNFKFGKKKTLVYHCQTRHSGQRTIFPCPYCQRVFYYFWGLTRHLHNNHRKHPSDIDRMRKSLRRRAYKQDITAIPLATLQQLESSKGKEAASRRTRPSMPARKVVAASKAVGASVPAERNKPSPELSGLPSRRRRVEVITPAHSKLKKAVDVYKKVYLNKRNTVSAGNTRSSASLKEKSSRKVEVVAKPHLSPAKRSSPSRETVNRKKIVVAAKPRPSSSKEGTSTRKRLVAKALRMTRSKQVYIVEQSPPLSPSTTSTKQLTAGSAGNRSGRLSDYNPPAAEAKANVTQATKDQKVAQSRQVSRSSALPGDQPTNMQVEGGAAAKMGLKNSNPASIGGTLVVNEIPRTVLVPKEKDAHVSETVGVVSSTTNMQKIIVLRKEAFISTQSDQAKLKPSMSATPATPRNTTATGVSNKEQDKKMPVQPQIQVKAATASGVLTRTVDSVVVQPPLLTRLNVRTAAASHSAVITNASSSVPQKLIQTTTKSFAATSPSTVKNDASHPASQTRTKTFQEISSSSSVTGNENGPMHLTRASSYAVTTLTPSTRGTPTQSGQPLMCPHCQRVFGRKISLESHTKICSKAKPQPLTVSQNEIGCSVILVGKKLEGGEGPGSVSQTSSRRVVHSNVVVASASTLTARDSSAGKSEPKTQSQQSSASSHPKQTIRDVPTRNHRQTGSQGTKHEGISSLNQRGRNHNFSNASSSRESSVESHGANDVEIQSSDHIVERESRSRRKADSKASSSRDSSVDSVKTRSSDTKQSQPPSRSESTSSTRSSRERSVDTLGKVSQQVKAKLEENLLIISRQRLSQQLHAATTTREKDGTKESSSSSVPIERKGKAEPAKGSPTKIIVEKVLPQRTVTTTVLRKNPREKSSEVMRNPPVPRSGLSAQDNLPTQPSRPGVPAHLSCSVEMSQYSQREAPTVIEKQSIHAEKKGTLQVKPSQISINQPQLIDAQQAGSWAAPKGGELSTTPKVNHQGAGASTSSNSEQASKEAVEGLSQRPRRKRRAPSKVMESMESYAGPAAKKGAHGLTSKGEGGKWEEKDVEDEESVTIVEEIWMEKKPGRPTERIKSNRIYVVEPARAGRLTCQDTRKVGQIVDESGLTCLQCDQNFTSVSNLRRHAIRHLGWRRFKCRLCRFCSYNRSECNTHIMRTHPERLRSSGSGGARIDTFITDLGRQGASVRSLKKRQTLDSRRQQGEKEGGEAGSQRTSRRKKTGSKGVDPDYKPDVDIETDVAPTITALTRSSSRRKLTKPTSSEALPTTPASPPITTAVLTPPTVTKIIHSAAITTCVTAPTTAIAIPVCTASSTTPVTLSPTLPTSIKPASLVTTNPVIPASSKSPPPSTFNISTRNSPRKFDTRPYPRPPPVASISTRKGTYTKPLVSSLSESMSQSMSEESQRTSLSMKEKEIPVMVGKESVVAATAEGSSGSQVLNTLQVTMKKEAEQPPKPQFVSAQKSGLEISSAGVTMAKDGHDKSAVANVEEAEVHSTVIKSYSGVVTRSGGTADAKDAASKTDRSLQPVSSTSDEGMQEGGSQANSKGADMKHDRVEVKGDKKEEVKEQPEEAAREEAGKLNVKRSGKDVHLLEVALEEKQTLPQQFMAEDAAMETCDEKSSTST